MDLSNLVSPLPAGTPPPKPYWQVLKEYQDTVQQHPDVATMPVHEFAQGMNELTNSRQYDSAVGTDNALRRAAGNIDVELHGFGGARPGWTGPTLSGTLGGPREGFDLPQLVGGAAQQATGALGGSPELQQTVGHVAETLPRTAFDMGVAALVAAPTGEAAFMPTLAALSGVGTYGETGSTTQAAISGATAALFPKAAEAGGQAVLKRMGAATVAKALPDLLQNATKLGIEKTSELGEQLIPQGVTQHIAKFLGSQAGMFALGQGSATAETLAGEGTWSDKLARLKEQVSPEGLTSAAIAQLPWTALDLVHGGNAAKQLEEAYMPAWRDDFQRRFNDKFTSLGNEPLDKPELNKLTDKVLQAKPDAPYQPIGDTGAVLASMDAGKVSMDLKRPVKTNEGDWNMGDALQSTKVLAEGYKLGHPEEYGDVDDMRLYTALRQYEGLKLSKQDLSQRAAMWALETTRTDNIDAAGGSDTFLEQQDRRDKQLAFREDLKNQREAAIVAGITPGSPTYDQNLHQRIALVSGSLADRLEAGITGDVQIPAGAAGNVPLRDSIIDTVRGNRTVIENKSDTDSEIELARARLDKVNEQLRGHGDDLFGPDAQTLTAQRAELEKMVDDLESGGGTDEAGRSKANQLTAEATFAARNAAYQYNRPLDVNDPNSVKQFYNTIQNAIRRGELGYLRQRDTQPYHKDANGQIQHFDTREDALAEATRLNAGREDKSRIEYTVPVTDFNGKYRIIDNHYFRTESLSPQEAGEVQPIHELGEGMEFKGGEDEGGLDTDMLTEYEKGLHELEQNAIMQQLFSTVNVKDPAHRLAMRESLVRNVTDWINAQSNLRLTEILREGLGLDENDKPFILKKMDTKRGRFVSFLQFLRDKPELITLKAEKVGDRVKVRGVGDLEELNKDMGPYGFTEGKKLNSNKNSAGLNFFEEWSMLTKAIQKDFVDPRALYQRPDYETSMFYKRKLIPQLEGDTKVKSYYIPWSPEFEGQLSNTPGAWNVPGVKGDEIVKFNTDEGERRVEGGANPLKTLIIQLAKTGGTTDMGTFADMYKRYVQHADSQLLELLDKLTSTAYGRSVPVAIGFAKDVEVKGYYARDSLVRGRGIFLSPWSEPLAGRRFRKLDNPEDILPHIVHELGHAHTVYAYYNDPGFRAEVDRVYQFIKERHTDLVSTLGDTYNHKNLHALNQANDTDGALEMLAGVFNDTALHSFLRGIRDPFEQLPDVPESSATMLDRLYGAIRRVFRKIVGDDGANTMLDRVTQLANTAVVRQEKIRADIGLVHTGKIYDALREIPQGTQQRSDIVSKTTPVGVERTPATRPQYPWADDVHLAQSAYKDAVSYRQNQEELFRQVQSNMIQDEDAADWSGHLDRLQKSLDEALTSEAIAGRYLQNLFAKRQEAPTEKQVPVPVSGAPKLGEVQGPPPGEVEFEGKKVPYYPEAKGVPPSYVSGVQPPKMPLGLLESKISAGDGFSFPLQEYDENKNKLGKHTLPRNSVVPVATLKTIGRDKGQLSDNMIELFKQLVPKAFGGESVNIKMLVDGLKKNGPVVETKKLTGESVDSTGEQSIHELETIGLAPIFDEDGKLTHLQDAAGNSVELNSPKLTERQQQLIDNLQRLDEGRGPTTLTGGARYSFLAPKPESEMPGYVEGLVRVPLAEKPIREQEFGQRVGDYPDREKGARALYSGPHFGSEDTNVLSFFRGYIEHLPDGTKAFHVIEVQSDWGQEVRDSKTRERGVTPQEESHFRQMDVADHPLLHTYESLALKAAIQHAKEIGATKVILSDAETAMMTEGHDRVANTVLATPENVTLAKSLLDRASQFAENDGYRKLVEAVAQGKDHQFFGDEKTTLEVAKDGFKLEPSQAKGMRLHYDQTLPSTMEKLTGVKGERVEVGTHKAVNNDSNLEAGIIGSPVFRNPDGNPKTQITGRAYDITPQAVDRSGLLESRVTTPPQPAAVLDSMNAYSDEVSQDTRGRYWFHPVDMQRFQQVFGPVLGAELKPQQRSGIWGYSVRALALNNITANDLALMPEPVPKPWAATAYETMRKAFKLNQYSDEDANAYASYNVQFASLLKGTEGAVWTLGDANKGVAFAWQPSKIAALTTKATGTAGLAGGMLRHESAHLAGFAQDVTVPSAVKASIDQVHEVFARLTPDERSTMVDSLHRISDEVAGRVSWVYDPAKSDPNEFAAEFMNHVGEALGAARRPNVYVRDLMRFAGDEVSNLTINSVLMRTVALDKLNGFLEQQAFTQGLKPDNMTKAVAEIAGVYKGMMRDAVDIALDQGDFYLMRGIYPDKYKELLGQAAQRIQGTVGAQGMLLASRVYEPMVDKVKEFVGLPDPDGRMPIKPTLWQRTFMQFQQLANDARLGPFVRPFYDVLSAASGMQHQAQLRLETLMAGVDKSGKLIDDSRTKVLDGFKKSARLRDLFDRIAMDVNMEGDKRFAYAKGKAGGDIMAMNEPINVTTPEFMNALYRKYKVAPADQETLNMVFNGTRNQMVDAAGIMVRSQQSTVDQLGGQAIIRGTDMMWPQARDAAKLLGQAIVKQDAGDMEGASALAEQFNSLVTDTDLRNKVYNLMTTGYENANKLERFLYLRSPYFMSERRFGDYGLWWRDKDDTVQKMYFKDSDAREKFIKREGVEPIRQTDPGKSKNFGVPDEFFSTLDEIQANTDEKIKDIFGADEAAKISQEMNFSGAMREALNARDVLNATTPRRLADTRKYLDMFDTHSDFINSVNAAAKNRFIRRESQLMLDSPAFANQPLVKKLIQQHIDQAMIPDSALGTALQSVNFVYWLGGNVSSMVMQSLHQLTGLAPMLTDRGASVSGSYATIANANKLYMEAHKFGRGEGVYSDPVVQDMVRRGQQDGSLKVTWLDQFDHSEDLSMVNRMRGTDPGNLQLYSAFDLLKNRAYQGLNMMRKLYSIVPEYNREIGFVSSVLHFKKQGLTGDELYREAKFLNDNAMFPGGKYNRPVGLFSINPRSAAQALWSLQTYANGLTTLMGSLVKKSTMGQKLGLTPAQVVQSRKAAVQMIATQWAFAGALGMPFAHLILTGLQKLFPDTNLQQDVRDLFAQLGGDDKALGGWLSSALTTGIPSAMDYAPDIGSRMELAGVTGVSPKDGLSWESLLGPTGGLVSNVFKALQDGKSEPLRGVHDLMPTGARRLWETLEQGAAFKSGSGTQLVTDLSPVEQAIRAVGFVPSRVARLRQAEDLSKISESAQSAESRQFADETSQLLEQGRDSEAKQKVLEKAQNRKDMSNVGTEVAKRFEQRNLPVDVRNFGNRQTVDLNRGLHGVLGTQSEGPSNVDRVMLQREIAGRLGLHGPSNTAIRQASIVDYLLQQNPHLTRPEAVAIAQRRATAEQVP